MITRVLCGVSIEFLEAKEEDIRRASNHTGYVVSHFCQTYSNSNAECGGRKCDIDESEELMT